MSGEDMEANLMDRAFRYNYQNTGNPSCRRRTKSEKMRFQQINNMSIAKSFKNSQNQSVIIPDLVSDSKYRFLIELAVGYQESLTEAATEVGFTFASGRPCKPRITGIIPALTELTVATLEVNFGRTYSRRSPSRRPVETNNIAITFDDMLYMFYVIGILPLVNAKSFRQALRNVIAKNRDDMNRQISLPVLEILNKYKIRELSVPVTTARRPRIGYYLSKR